MAEDEDDNETPEEYRARRNRRFAHLFIDPDDAVAEGQALNKPLTDLRAKRRDPEKEGD